MMRLVKRIGPTRDGVTHGRLYKLVEKGKDGWIQIIDNNGNLLGISDEGFKEMGFTNMVDLGETNGN